ncbi:MAG TPA: hypothetical protein DCM14_06295 [Clostridiales bacterium UBA8153]|nr:hypothetical protein [Clostridiales bacterium UBA8153]
MCSGEPARIIPHLWYASEAEEAARFYTSSFPDSQVDSITLLPSDVPGRRPGSVKLVDFTLLGQGFKALAAGPHHEFNDAVSLIVLCRDQEELDRYWNALLAGGGRALECGWLMDRFGLRWQLVPVVLARMLRDPSRARRVADALLTMVKIDIAALQKAYDS